MRRNIRGLAVAVVAALGITLGAAPALALSAEYTATGLEIAATSTQGTFVGTARGSDGDAAAWRAVVEHAVLNRTAPAAITGGSLALVSIGGDTLESVSGAFTSGTVTFVSAAPGCSTERFAIAAALTTTRGAATFKAALTHYRILLFGRCTTYAATVTGKLAFG